MIFSIYGIGPISDKSAVWSRQNSSKCNQPYDYVCNLFINLGEGDYGLNVQQRYSKHSTLCTQLWYWRWLHFIKNQLP